MAVAGTLQAFLNDRNVEYEVVPHSPAGTSSQTAQAAHVPGAQLAKAVVISEAGRLSVVVIPATEQVHLGELRQELGDTCALATEPDIERVFPDCDRGSVPPFGEAYGLDVLVDDALLEQDRLFAESGDRGALVALAGDDFRALMRPARHGRYGYPG